MNETITKEQVLEAYNNAPDLVRDVFSDEKTTQVIVNLKERLQLHIDQAGILGKEVGYLLLGITDPSKFMNRLKSNGFADLTVNTITMEVNQKIFVPLREQMRKGSVLATEATEPPVPQQPTTPTQPADAFIATGPRSSTTFVDELPKGTFAPPPQSPRYPNQENVSAYIHRPAASTLNTPRPHPAPQAIPRPVPPPLRNPVMSPTPIAPAPPHAQSTQTLTDASGLLEDHEEPSPTLSAPAAAPLQFTMPTARTLPPPPNLSGTTPSAPTTPFQAQPKPVAPPEPVKPYSVDPYREPVDEDIQ